MLEAVNSSIQNATLVRANAEQQSVAGAFAGNPDRVQKAAPRAPYISPYVHVDVNFDKAVLQIRDSETGDVLDQFPSEPLLEAQARAEARRQVARQAAVSPTPGQQPRVERQAAVISTDTAPKADPAPAKSSAATAQQLAAFQSAARSGNANAGNVTLFA